MGRLIIISILLSLIGCGAAPIKINTQVKETFVPIIYSPAPPVIKRPALPIHVISSEQLKNDGQVVKHYKATIKALIGYSKELETALGEYYKINKAYEAEEANLKVKFGKVPGAPLK